MANLNDQHQGVLVADDDVTDSEAEIQSLNSETTSLKSSILAYRMENGRSYHTYKDGKYAWPSDEKENDRLDMQNEICFLTFHGKLGFAPPCDEGANIGRVLDLGTGTGLWAIEYGDQHPETEVLGVDLSPIQPRDVPPNVKFEVDDVEEEWLYSRPFDYIHLRFMNGSLANWEKIIKKAYDNLVPGGYFEIQEADFVMKADDDTLPPERPLAQFSKLIREAAAKFGRAFVNVPELKDIMAKIGFTDVVLNSFKWPSNTWPKDSHHKKIGEWNYHNFAEAAEAMAMAPLTRGHNWTSEEVQVFLIGVRKDMRDRSIHSYIPVYTIVGRKPLEEDTLAPSQDHTATPAQAAVPDAAPAGASGSP